jgi:hypothetical protein
MRVVGTAADWINLIDSLVPDILRLVVDAWAAMPPPASNAREDPTSEALCRCLRTGRNRCDLPFNVHLQLVELDPAAGEDQGRMDIVFAPLVPREDIYFCLECKRLNVRENGVVRPYASEYVRHGMLRFVRGQYSVQVRHGGMLGFVLDGDVPSAMTNVEVNIRAKCEELGMDSPGAFRVSGILPKDGRIRETHHRRAHATELFAIHHLFMAGDPNAPPLARESVDMPAPADRKPRKRQATGNRRKRKNA